MYFWVDKEIDNATIVFISFNFINFFIYPQTNTKQWQAFFHVLWLARFQATR